jgi:Tfp pilus assembly protein PilO
VFLFLLPTYKEIKSFRFEIEKKEAEIKYQEEKISHLNNLIEKLNQYQPELQKIQAALPPDPSLPSLFYLLQKKASDSGLTLEEISAFSISPFKEKERIKQINFEIKASGSYQAFKDFLLALEKSARLIEIEELSFSAPIKKETPISYQLKIKTYSY